MRIENAMGKLATLFLLIFAFSVSFVLAQSDEEEEALVTDRPDMTESSTTVGHLRLQIETGFSWERIKNGALEESNYFNPTLFRYGIGDNFELRIETNSFSKLTTNLGTLEVDSATGFSPIALGLKYNLVSSHGLGEPSMGVLFHIEMPSGTDEFESDDYAYILKFLAEWDLTETYSFGTNLGVLKQMDELGVEYTFFSGTAVIGISLTEELGGFVELAFDSAESSAGGSSLLFDTGITYLVNNNLQFDVAFGTGLSGDSVPDFLMTTGLCVRF